MSRTNTLFAALLLGFVVFTTAKGNLKGYLSVLGLVK